MLKRPITYFDFDGNEATEEFYFNLSKVELAQLQFSSDEGFSAMLEKIMASEDKKAILDTFTDIIGLSYGIRSDDGKRFIKSPQLSEEFKQTPAFDALIMSLVGDAGAAAAFVIGVIPSDMQSQIDLKELGLEVQDVELPATLNEYLEKPDPEPWITENREPTKKERIAMTREQLLRALKAREERQTREKENEDLLSQFDDSE